MKKLLIAGVTALALSATVANAGEHGAHHDNTMHGDHGGHGNSSHSPFYVVFKGLIITGDTASHGAGVTLDGDTGGGVGFDFGYKLTHNLALEFVTSYAGNRVTETVESTVKSRNAAVTTSHGATTTTTTADAGHGATTTDAGGHSAGAGHSLTTDGNYFTYGLSLAYTMHLTERAGLLFKVGYEGENETINGLGIDTTNDGFTYALGAEVKLNKHYELVFEYEGSSIKGPRGSSLFAGVKYNF